MTVASSRPTFSSSSSLAAAAGVAAEAVEAPKLVGADPKLNGLTPPAVLAGAVDDGRLPKEKLPVVAGAGVAEAPPNDPNEKPEAAAGFAAESFSPSGLEAAVPNENPLAVVLAGLASSFLAPNEKPLVAAGAVAGSDSPFLSSFVTPNENPDVDAALVDPLVLLLPKLDEKEDVALNAGAAGATVVFRTWWSIGTGFVDACFVAISSAYFTYSCTAAIQLTLGFSFACSETNDRKSLFSTSIASWYDDADFAAPETEAAEVVDAPKEDPKVDDAAGAAEGFGSVPNPDVDAAGLSVVSPEKPAKGFAFAAVSPWKPLNGLAAPAAAAEEEVVTVVATATGFAEEGRLNGPTRALTILRWRIESSDARWNPFSNESAETS